MFFDCYFAQNKEARELKKFVKICEKQQVPNNTMKDFTLVGYDVLLVNVEGEFYALQSKCSHLKYPLYLGRLKGKILTCGSHSAKFDVTTGKVLNPPAKESLKTFKVKTEGTAILVELDQ